MKMQNFLVASALVFFLVMATVVPKLSFAAHVGMQEASVSSTDKAVKGIRKMPNLPSESAMMRRKPPSPPSPQSGGSQSPRTPDFPGQPPPPPPCYGPVPSNQL